MELFDPLSWFISVIDGNQGCGVGSPVIRLRLLVSMILRPSAVLVT